MKIQVKQVPPDWQKSPMWPGEWQDDAVMVHGNKNYNAHTTDDFDRAYDRFYNNEKALLRALRLMTGTEYTKRTIRGCWQVEWQDLYYPASYGGDYARTFEIEYFNLGTQWQVDPDGDNYSVYCYGDDYANEIAQAIGVKPEQIELFQFTGWEQTAQYERMGADV